MHPRLRQLRVRQRRARVQHLRQPRRQVLRGDREGGGKDEGLSHVRRRGPQEVPSARVPDRPEQPAQPHLLAVGELRAVPAERHPHPVARQKV